jgi:hypothetical protein
MNLRVFKKDIDFLTEDFLSDALISMGFAREESKRENILGIINEAIDLRDETYVKINHPEKENLKHVNTNYLPRWQNASFIFYIKLQI